MDYTNKNILTTTLKMDFTKEPMLLTEDGKILGRFAVPKFMFMNSVQEENVTKCFYEHCELSNVRLIVSFFEENDGIHEIVTVENNGSETFEINESLCYFNMEDTEGFRFCAIPFRRSGVDGRLYDWSEAEFKADKHEFPAMRNPIYSWIKNPNECSEGWAIYNSEYSLLVMKYNTEAIEFSVLSPLEKGMSFGGVAIGKLGDPEEGKIILPGASYTFGLTRYAICGKGYRGAYEKFRKFMTEKGHRPNDGYTPEFVWNELYDNPAWYERDKNIQPWEELKSIYYRKKDMIWAAEQAKLHGCKCLYLDPGWDTSFGSNIWDEAKLGDMKEFSQEIYEKYHLTLGLHTPLAPWSDPAEYDQSELMMTKEGNNTGELCVMSEKYHEEKLKRLKKLCECGAKFFLYDGSWYSQPCYNPNHGHKVPSTRQEHVEAINKLARELHLEYPKAVIEQHDSIIGPGTPRYMPLYSYKKANSGDPDEIWAFEFMNDPLDDFNSGRAYSMYYANLAYNVPFYLHIDLRFDNEEGLSFWWFASTCRHLGVGGTDKDPVKREKQVKMTNLYAKYQDIYSKGTFYGLDEIIHGHTLENRTIVDFFNPTTEDCTKKITIEPSEIGLSSTEKIDIMVKVPKAGHCAVLLQENGGKIQTEMI